MSRAASSSTLESEARVEGTAGQESRQHRLKTHTAALLGQYHELLRCAQVHGEVEQQVGELRTSVLIASMLESTERLLDLSDELRSAALHGDHAALKPRVDAAKAMHEAASSEGHRRLHRVADEMQEALGELEDSYYTCSVHEDGSRW